MNKIVKASLIIIVLVALVLRFYKLDSVPPSLNWDEVDAGYNAYTIANWARDEWGNFLPLVFTSFGDDKHPVHIYLTVPFVKLFGLFDFSVRSSGALVGVLSVIAIFFLARLIFKSDQAALLSALFLTISPYHLQFSRGLWEVNFALFFFFLGLLLFYLSVYKKGWLFSFSVISFGLSILSYHSSKIIVPPVVLLLFTLYFKNLLKLKSNFYIGMVILVAFAVLLIFEPRLLGAARVKQTQFSKDEIEKTRIFQKTKNEFFGLLEVTFNQYLLHFTPQYLFETGDQNPRNSVKKFGQFLKIDLAFLVIGLFYLIKLRSKVTLVLLVWLLLSPIPSSLVSHAPNATRALFMMGSMHLISALGAYKILEKLKSKTARIVILLIFLVFLGVELFSYLQYYFNAYPKKDAIEWQYGYKQAVEYVKSHPDYSQIFITDIRSQPYIYFLYYLKTPLPDFLNTVVYNRSESKSYSTVSYFDKYYFGGWDPIESTPNPGILYIVSPSQYDGLRHKSSFEVKKVIYYPDGGAAFFLISAQ